MLLAEQVRMQHARLEREQKSHLDASTTLCSADHVLLRYLASGCGSQPGRVIGMSGAESGMDAGEAYGKQIRKEVRSRAKTAAAGFRFAFTTRIIRDITRCAYGEGFLCPDAIRWATEAQLREMLDMPEDTTLSKLLPLIDNLPEYWNACNALETLIRGAHGEAPAALYKGLYLHVRENMVEAKGDRWQLPHAREIMNKACRAFGEGLVEGLADVKASIRAGDEFGAGCAPSCAQVGRVANMPQTGGGTLYTNSWDNAFSLLEADLTRDEATGDGYFAVTPLGGEIQAMWWRREFSKDNAEAKAEAAQLRAQQLARATAQGRRAAQPTLDRKTRAGGDTTDLEAAAAATAATAEDTESELPEVQTNKPGEGPYGSNRLIRATLRAHGLGGGAPPVPNGDPVTAAQRYGIPPAVETTAKKSR